MIQSRFQIVLACVLFCSAGAPLAAGERDDRPSILLCISDDQSWLHTSASGDPVIKTPNFDRIAREGVRFTHAFCASPSCTPSRGALLSGQHIWRLKQGGNLWSTLPAGIPVYPDLLAQAGYHVGYMRKGWGGVKEVEAGEDPLRFEGLPEDGLYWMVVKKSRRLERIFTIRDGLQRWW